MTRIALVSEHASPLAVLGGVDAGGQNVYVAHLARALAHRGHAVTVYTRRDAPSLERRVPMGGGVTVVHVDAGPPEPIDKDRLLPHMDDFAADLTGDLRRHGADVVHSHFWMSGLAASATTASLGLPLVHTFHALGSVKRRHQGPSDTSPPERQGVEERLRCEADAVVATCTDEVAELDAWPGCARHLAIVPCGFDDSAFRPTGPALPRTGRLRLSAVSRLVARKGLADAVEALAQLTVAGVDAELVVAGGPHRSRLDDDAHATELRTLADHRGVAARVHWLGGVDAATVAALHRSSDLFVAAPWYEPFGIAPVEAMGCGLPVVGTAVGGLLDTVVDGGTGLLVPPRAPGRLAGALHELLTDAERRTTLGRRAVWRSHRRFTWPAVAKAMERVYAGVIDERAGWERRA